MRIALVLGLLVSVAYAGDMPPSLRVTATATSSLDKYPPWMAIDGNLGNSTAWCPNKGDGVRSEPRRRVDARPRTHRDAVSVTICARG